MPKSEVAGSMKVNAYVVLCRALEEGIAVGWNRAHKHTASPTEEAIKDSIENEVLNAICEFFKFDGQEDA